MSVQKSYSADVYYSTFINVPGGRRQLVEKRLEDVSILQEGDDIHVYNQAGKYLGCFNKKFMSVRVQPHML